ncbi:MAG TPA: sigma-70 family RNA polymerase sigma factor [Gemmataceae bacterium]|nr:sigma-70 family RNA polymerase sigma factor [Gemmataceae bacterium]
MATGQLAPILHYLRKVTSPTGGDISDAELLSRFRIHRDDTAFTALVRRHGPMVLAVCRRVVGDGHAAEDAFQATFLVLARKAGSLAQPELLANWLHGVAYRTAAKAKTEAARRRVHERQAVRSQEIDSSMEFEWQDLRAVLDEEVNRLPERYRVPVVLCYLQGQTNAEAARRLGCSRGTVATLLARARDKLRRRLTQRGVGLSVGFGLAALTPMARGGAAPLALEQATVKAATLLAAGQMHAAGALAAQAVALAKGVSKGMLMEKLKIPAVVLLMTALVGTGAGISAYRAGAQESDVAESKSEEKPRPQKKIEKPTTPVAKPEGIPEAASTTYRTPNFVVTAPTREIAEQVGKAAEYNRKVLAGIWLGKGLADWAEPCPVRVTITETTGSATEFAFQDNIVEQRRMILEGPLDRIFADLLPHEITHTILAEWRGKPISRWADEGAAMLSESAIGRASYEQTMEKALRTGRLLPLTELLPKMNYPKDVGTFYAQSLSLTDFLVTLGGRRKFLAFVAQGEEEGWDKASQSVYSNTIEELEQRWLRFAKMRLAEKRDDSRREVRISNGNRQLAQRPAPTVGESLPTGFTEQLPDGPAPIQMLVRIDEQGRLTIAQKVTYYQPETETITLKNGRKHRVTYYDEKHSYRDTVYDLHRVQIHDVKGRVVEENEVRKRLKQQTLALISANGRPVDPLHLRLYKEDTLVFVLPPPPPPTPVAPSYAPPVAPIPYEPAPAVAPLPVPIRPESAPVPYYPVQPAPAVAPPPPVADPRSTPTVPLSRP